MTKIYVFKFRCPFKRMATVLQYKMNHDEISLFLYILFLISCTFKVEDYSKLIFKP